MSISHDDRFDNDDHWIEVERRREAQAVAARAQDLADDLRIQVRPILLALFPLTDEPRRRIDAWRAGLEDRIVDLLLDEVASESQTYLERP